MDDTAIDAGDLAPQPRPLGGLPRSLAEIVTVRQGGSIEHELVLAPGATAADVTAAMILMPPAAALVGHHGDVEVSLVFRESRVPAAASTSARATGPEGTTG
jgi:uncharacterized repeat protein (TIGR03917 family)